MIIIIIISIAIIALVWPGAHPHALVWRGLLLPELGRDPGLLEGTKGSQGMGVVSNNWFES